MFNLKSIWCCQERLRDCPLRRWFAGEKLFGRWKEASPQVVPRSRRRFCNITSSTAWISPRPRTVWVGHSCPTPLILFFGPDNEPVLKEKPKVKSVGRECPTHTSTPYPVRLIATCSCVAVLTAHAIRGVL